MGSEPYQSCINILAVVVTFKRDIKTSITYQSLMNAYLHHQNSKYRMSVIIYDNSPEPQIIDWSTNLVSIEYVHDSTNAGLAKAYNHALDTAISNGFEWLLLLDQDSTLPEDFTANLIKTIEVINSDESIVAIVPTVQCQGKTVSPSIIKFGGYFRPVDARVRGICRRPVTSINSGTMIRSSFIHSVGGFNSLFWLDYLDHWIFSIIYTNNKRVFISESILEHELSIMDYHKEMNLKRYDNILRAEILYLKMCRPKYEKYYYMIRLLGRMKVQLLERNKIIYFKSTFRAFINILGSSPK